MKIREIIQSIPNLRFILILLLSILFIVHIVEYNNYMRYEDVKTGDTYNPEEQYYLNLEVEPVVVDYDLATKRDNTLFKLMMDLFVLSLLFPRKYDKE